MKNFIGIYKNALSDNTCDLLKEVFNNAKDQQRQGTVGTYGMVSPKIKQSTDLNILDLLKTDSRVPQVLLPQIKQALDMGMVSYLKEFPFSTALKDTPEDKLMENLLVNYSFFNDFIIMQKYNKGTDGFHGFHEDNGAFNPANNRVLVCMFYINDVEKGGETEFYHYDLKVKPTKGTLIIFPTYFTHLHKGHIPITDDKYILNIWLLKNNASHWRMQKAKLERE
tara:strand:+ start:233 stop:904 length:672 start_codon:yes stop_codon:yes gene_type:complete